MNIKLDSCRIFKEAAEQNSFSGAAEKLFISQSAVSQSIRQLESDLGVALFNRQKKGVALTAAGKLLYEYAASAINMLETARQRIENLKNVDEGELRIGASDTVAQKLLLPKLEQFSRTYPNVKLKIVNRTSPDSAAMLKDGRLDIAFLNTPFDDDRLEFIPFMQIHDVFVGEREYCRKTYTYKEICGLPLILLERSSSSRRYIDRLFMESGALLSPEIELGSHELLLSFARIGLGVSCVIREFSLEFIKNGELSELSVTPPVPPREISIAALKDVSLSHCAKKFIEICRK